MMEEVKALTSENEKLKKYAEKVQESSDFKSHADENDAGIY